MHVCTGAANCLLDMLLQRWVGFNPGEGTEEGVGLHSLPCFLKGGHQSRKAPPCTCQQRLDFWCREARRLSEQPPQGGPLLPRTQLSHWALVAFDGASEVHCRGLAKGPAAAASWAAG